MVNWKGWLNRSTAPEARFGAFTAKFSRAISHVNVDPKTDVSEISSVSIMRVSVVDDHIYIC
jgi:hypothetical protein